VKRYAELAAGHGGTPDGDGRPLTT
jgi:hypothetical protein